MNLPTTSTFGTDIAPISRQTLPKTLPTASTFGMDIVPSSREPLPTVASYGISILSAEATPPPPPPVEEAKKTKSKKQHRPRAEKMLMEQAHYALVLEAAQTVTRIFDKHGLSCAVFGSLAAKLYGSARCPKDVDMLISQDFASANAHPHSAPKPLLTAAELKDLLLRADAQHFYLKLPRDPAAEYRILWYRQRYRGPECKVDILVPGTMHLPRLPRHRVVFLSPRTTAEEDGDIMPSGAGGADAASISVPVVPFALLLAHKLQGWADHRAAEEAHQRGKQHQDAGTEVRALVDARAAGRSVLGDEELFDEEFRVLTQGRVRAYCEAFPDRAEEWRKLGFETS
ncbi:hypothetical protein BJ912DRAFT_1060565 [Pholiota molesta]|nr:hypothetical protein BJ912DRAFT_1060565 [Pholiota molesta]